MRSPTPTTQRLWPETPWQSAVPACAQVLGAPCTVPWMAAGVRAAPHPHPERRLPLRAPMGAFMVFLGASDV